MRVLTSSDVSQGERDGQRNAGNYVFLTFILFYLVMVHVMRCVFLFAGMKSTLLLHNNMAEIVCTITVLFIC